MRFWEWVKELFYHGATRRATQSLPAIRQRNHCPWCGKPIIIESTNQPYKNTEADLGVQP